MGLEKGWGQTLLFQGGAGSWHGLGGLKGKVFE